MNNDPSRGRTARRVMWIAAAALAVLHQDLWAWDDRSLVLGFLPMTLAYQMAYSAASAALWAFAVIWAWPREIEAWADGLIGGDGVASGASSGASSGGAGR